MAHVAANHVGVHDEIAIGIMIVAAANARRVDVDAGIRL